MILQIRPTAEVDLEEIAFRIGRDHPLSAKRFLTRAAETFELLARIPKLGASLAVSAYPEARLFSIRRFRNYIVLYLPIPDGVEVLRVVDARRDLPALFGQVD